MDVAACALHRDPGRSRAERSAGRHPDRRAPAVRHQVAGYSACLGSGDRYRSEGAASRTVETGDTIMTERVWDKFLTERDKAVFAAGGLGARAYFGKRPALLMIDVSWAFC